jgi:hypothetical protein
MRWLGKYVTHKWMILEPWAGHLPRRRAKLGRSRTAGAQEGGVSLLGSGVASKSNRAPLRRAYMQQRFVILLLSASCLERGEDEAGG